MGWLKNSGGKPDAMLTFAAGSFVITSLCVILSMLESINIGEFSLDVKSPDVMLLTGYLAACFTSYVVRRNKKDDIDSKSGSTKEE